MASPFAKLLGRKQRTDEQEAVEQFTAETEADPMPKKRKPSEKMSSVISETVPQAAVDVLKQNHRFTLADDQSWAILVLPVDIDSPFGGLSKKNQRDEEKGQIIGLIEDDTIQTAMTPQMRDRDVLGIIPTKQTMDRMREYQILTSQQYFWGVVTTNEDNSELDVTVLKGPSFDDVVKIADGTAELSALYPYVFRYTQEGAFQDSDQQEPSVETAAVEAPVADEDTEVAVTEDDAAEAFEETIPEDEESVTTQQQHETAPELAEPDDGVDYSQLDQEPDFDDGENFDDAPDIDAMVLGQDQEGASEGAVVAAGDDDDDHDDFGDDYGDEQDDEAAAYIEQFQGQVITEEDIRDQIVQRFMSGDLDLEVSLEPFEKTFQSEAPAIVFDVGEDTSDWLGSQVAQLVRQANTELLRLRQEHMDELRAKYVELLGTQAEDISQKVSTDRQDTVYYELWQSADREYEEAKRHIEAERDATVKALVEHFNEQAEAAGRQAYETAKAQYKHRHGSRQEEQLANVASDIQRRHEESYHDKQRTILDLRKKEAHRRMDFGISHVLRVLAEYHAEQQERERLVLGEWNDRLLAYIDEHRQTDVARANAMAEQLARDNSIAQLQAEHTAEMERRESEFQERLRRAQLEIDRVHEHAQAERKQLTSDWEHRMEQLNSEWEYKVDGDRRRIESLQQQVETADERFERQEREHDAEIQRYKDANEQYSHQLEQSSQVQSRSNKILIVLMIVFGLAALFAGGFVGFGWGLGYE